MIVEANPFRIYLPRAPRPPPKGYCSGYFPSYLRCRRHADAAGMCCLPVARPINPLCRIVSMSDPPSTPAIRGDAFSTGPNIPAGNPNDAFDKTRRRFPRKLIFPASNLEQSFCKHWRIPDSCAAGSRQPDSAGSRAFPVRTPPSRSLWTTNAPELLESPLTSRIWGSRSESRVQGHDKR